MLRVEDCQPGVLVECIDDSAPRARDGGIRLKLRAIYTVLSLHTVVPYAVLRVEGMPRYVWALDRFRLVPDARLDQFRRQLTERLPRPWWWPKAWPHADEPVPAEVQDAV